MKTMYLFNGWGKAWLRRPGSQVKRVSEYTKDS